jgi:hypothetical protein
MFASCPVVRSGTDCEIIIG